MKKDDDRVRALEQGFRENGISVLRDTNTPEFEAHRVDHRADAQGKDGKLIGPKEMVAQLKERGMGVKDLMPKPFQL